MRTTRDIEPPLRRARLLAARAYPAWSIPRRAILSGHWDTGTKVRNHLTSEDGREWASSREAREE